jgi:hypothetical protein
METSASPNRRSSVPTPAHGLLKGRPCRLDSIQFAARCAACRCCCSGWLCGFAGRGPAEPRTNEE